MEFPDLGQHCSHEFCKQLDFLPMKCDACNDIFCKDHITYNRHSCASAYKKDVQVPVCPLCSKPVPVNRGELPDIKVGEHIDRDCQSDPAIEKRKNRSHRCTLKGCKQVEFVPVTCSTCRKNFCLKHRNPLDHDCHGFDDSGRSISDAGAAAVARQKPTIPGTSLMKSLKQTVDSKITNSHAAVHTASTANRVASIDEDEAFALAIQMSLNDTAPQASASTDAKNSLSQEQSDHLLAEALARSDQDFAVEQQRQRSMKKNCAVA